MKIMHSCAILGVRCLALGPRKLFERLKSISGQVLHWKIRLDLLKL